MSHATVRMSQLVRHAMIVSSLRARLVNVAGDCLRSLFIAVRDARHCTMEGKRIVSKTSFVAGWIASSVIAVLLAVGIATAIFAQSLPVVLGVAALEGVCLGVVQQMLLRRTEPAVALRWALATMAGAILGRGCEFLLDTAGQAYAVGAWPPIVQGAASGLVIGVLMAFPQIFVLRGHVPGAWRWLAVRGGAWALALVLLFIGTSALGPTYAAAPLVMIAAVATVFAMVAAIVGALEGFVMAGLLRLPNVDRGHHVAPRVEV
jgi:hypothetical protein